MPGSETMQMVPLRRALVSVSDKSGLAELCHALASIGVEIFSTGGTRRFLEEQGLSVRDVAAHTGFPELLHGRLKTLHPKIFGGILGRLDQAEDLESLERHGIVPFELVVVNLYPFERTVARPGVTRAEAIEQIDIGGPSLVRAAAKNHAFVAVATDPAQYPLIQADCARLRGTSAELRARLAGEAFARTAEYDRAIAAYLAASPSGPGPAGMANQLAATKLVANKFPESVALQLQLVSELRYGENPHQAAAVYRELAAGTANVISAQQLHGKELSYNNLLDLDSALSIARSLPNHAAVVIKHNNPCGAASAGTLSDAVAQALAGDPVSAFGSVLGLNQVVDRASAEFLATPGFFVEAIVAPGFAPEALEVLTTKPKWKNNVRLLSTGPLPALGSARQWRFLDGGALLQDADQESDPESEWRVVTASSPTESQFESLRFAWALVRHVKSNAIVLAHGSALRGVGAGQMSRVDAVEIAIRKAGERSRGSVLASDAFFPFPDSIQKAAAAGVAAIIQPGGSVKDEEVIAACDEYGLPMILTGRRHFKH